SEAASPEQQIPEQIPQPTPEQPIPEQIPDDSVIQNGPELDIFAKFENFRTDFTHQNLFHDIHPSLYYQPNPFAKIALRYTINKDLDRIQNGDLNELIAFQKNTREWVAGVNKEFEVAQLKKKGRLSIPENFFYETTVTNQIWRENLGLLDSDLNMHLKFGMEPKKLFVKKDFVENPEFEAFKAEV
ncbi:hypothetical protein A2U01_0025716, partial [Trifolium medium]|nr:hypothetical protein [Trifolium medium]